MGVPGKEVNSWEIRWLTPPLANTLSRSINQPQLQLWQYKSEIGDDLAASPGTIGDRVADAYRKHLFGASTLQSLPDHPRFVINTTNVQSGVLCRFSKPYMWYYRVGQIKNPTIELAIAVAASSAFPPVLSPSAT